MLQLLADRGVVRPSEGHPLLMRLGASSVWDEPLIDLHCSDPAFQWNPRFTVCRLSRAGQRAVEDQLD